MIEQKRLSPPTSPTRKFAVHNSRLKALFLSALLAFASMLLSADGLPALNLTVATLTAVALLTGGVIIAERSRQPFTALADAGAATNARILSLALLAWSVFLLLIFVGWQAAAIAALALPGLALIARSRLQRAVNGRLVLASSLIALPAIVGGAAATATVEPLALILFAIIFFWSGADSRLALCRDSIHAFADAPPPADQTALKRIHFQALQLVIISMLPMLLPPLIQVDGNFGFAYPLVAILMGILLVYVSSRLTRDKDGVHLRRLGDILTLYPFLLVLALIADHMLQ